MAETLTSPSPVGSIPSLSIPKVRIETVDALRGFALFGILLVHAAEWFSAGPLPSFVFQTHSQGIANNIVQMIIGIFFSGKFYTFFSFLFGLSFALMLTRNVGSSRSFYLRFAWRLVILGVIGFLHHLQWRGDILSIYAMLGFFMLLFSQASQKVVLTVGLLLVLNTPIRLMNVYDFFRPQPAPAKTAQKATNQPDNEANTLYKELTEGSYWEVMQSNYRGFKTKMEFQFSSGRIYVTLGFFLLGLYAGRRRLFQQLPGELPYFRKLTRLTGFGVSGLTAVGILLMVLFGSVQQPPKWAELTFWFLMDTQSAALTVFYIAGLTLVFQRVWSQRMVTILASVGKMALTSYILQTVFGTLIFMGYGLGLLGEIDAWQAALLAFPIFILQILFSRWWLSRFRYGPFEWLWRSLTYGHAQPMIR
ncbi:DUF418 domain-containing protein [Arsenicibacter rosenii]|uniref:DUF418 domain-containing protein n=1 Tax=Arsenicibacter rosenii TaxID=1750698 RepID=A0A1S2VND1_9BACT|nr:DUF418 domain-containing protein [Arsenicibacter rosenii]OIN59910.1 hypothetical protein BLX24_08675 [Arsenicibacter rosenii]